MKAAVLLVIATVLASSTAVSSTNFEDANAKYLSNQDYVEALIVPSSQKKNDNFYCVECLNIAKHVHDTIVKNMTESQFKTKLTAFCKLSKNFERECVAIVDRYAGIAFPILKTISPENVCFLIGVCHKKRRGNFDEVSAIEAHTKGNRKCLLCKKVIGHLVKSVKHGGKEEIKAALEHVCHKLGKLSRSCEKMVSKHADRIVELVMKHSDPEQICKELGMCRPTDYYGDFEIEMEDHVDAFQITDSVCASWQLIVSENKQSINNQLEQQMIPENGPFCLICEILITRLQSMFSTEAKQNRILRLFAFGCNIMPDFIRIPCNSVIEGFGLAVFDMFNKLDAQKACSFLRTSVDQTFVEDFNKALGDYLDAKCDPLTL